ncbi:MAG: thiosulfate sulfurtransferase [Micrococcales bacterium]|nr:MAG: thiosulfate sulfurtransferase [Micrococcales bacterium]PIE25868.1 MAG: thiosulfate sulfurtransferase [Micrococcales bacterium]
MRVAPATALLALGLATTVVAGCSSSSATSLAEHASSADSSVATAVARDMNVQQFAELVTRPDVVVLDVRTPAEYAQGHLNSARNLNVEDPGFAAAVSDLDPSATYAVYCRSGNRSDAALRVMNGAGLTNAGHLVGGISAWTSAGEPIAR